jgi:hypothetical protein
MVQGPMAHHMVGLGDHTVGLEDHTVGLEDYMVEGCMETACIEAVMVGFMVLG